MFEVRRPNAVDLCEAYFARTPEKICGLRSDSLALLLNMANVSFESNVLLVDNTRGLLAGALIEKCASYILRVEFSTCQNLQCNTEFLQPFNLAPQSTRRLASVHASVFLK